MIENLIEVVTSRPAISWVNALLTFLTLVVWLALAYTLPKLPGLRRDISVLLFASLGATVMVSGLSAWAAIINITIEYREWLEPLRTTLLLFRVAALLLLLQALTLTVQNIRK